MIEKVKVVIICTQNSARSQMTEGFFRKYGDDILEVHSAGFEPVGIHPYTVKVMEEIGVDISGQRSKSVKEFLGRMQFGYVIAVCKKTEGRCPVIFPGARAILSWPFEDPATFEGPEAEKLQMFRRVRDEIEEKVKAWITGYRTDHCK